MRVSAGLGSTILALAPARSRTVRAPAGVANGIAMREAVIPMPDGVKLAADLYLPDGRQARRAFPGPARVPALSQDGSTRARTIRFTRTSCERGYVVARVDIRGTGNSEGRLIAYEYTDQEQTDGEAVIDWLSKQPFSTRQGRHVRDLLGRLQLDPHGDAQPAGAQGDHRRGRHRRPLPGRRALHGRHHPRGLVGDGAGPSRTCCRARPTS